VLQDPIVSGGLGQVPQQGESMRCFHTPNISIGPSFYNRPWDDFRDGCEFSSWVDADIRGLDPRLTRIWGGRVSKFNRSS
jgi:hypothetical protein